MPMDLSHIRVGHAGVGHSKMAKRIVDKRAGEHFLLHFSVILELIFGRLLVVYGTGIGSLDRRTPGDVHHDLGYVLRN